MAAGMRQAMTSAPRMLFIALSFGAGHMRAASAVAEAIERRAPSADLRIVDAIAGSSLLFRAFYVWPYWAMLRYAPTLWRRMFASRVRHRSAKTAPEWLFRWGCAHVFDEIARFRPDAIVAAEVGACEIADIATRRGLTAARIVNVITDHHAEPAWVK